MIRRLIRLFVSLIVLGFAAYFFFFVPIGERTLYEHASRIASTEEAREFGREVSEAGERLGEKVIDSVQPSDAGAD